jgi:acetyltransferase-like isoleucine patch superfamily enzyme
MERSNVQIHATADVSDKAFIGPGTCIWHQSQVREGARIGSNCILGKDTYIDFNVQIGDNVKIQNGVSIYHGVTIESGVFIGPGAIFTNDKAPRAINPDGTLKGADNWKVSQTRICYGASIGAGAILLPITIGRFAMVGAGALVTKDIPDHALVIGNPAFQIGYVCKCGTSMEKSDSNAYRCPECNETYIF